MLLIFYETNNNSMLIVANDNFLDDTELEQMSLENINSFYESTKEKIDEQYQMLLDDFIIDFYKELFKQKYKGILQKEIENKKIIPNKSVKQIEKVKKYEGLKKKIRKKLRKYNLIVSY